MIHEPLSDSAVEVRAGLIGVGEFGTSLLAQAFCIPGFELCVLCDLEPERALAAWRSVGGAADRIALCESRSAALRAIEAGRVVVVPDAALLMDLPFDIVVEATGEPEVAAANAEAALAHGKHVAMVSKEADGVVGPVLARKARAAGLVHTPVDGDQPALLIRLVAWARSLGLEIVAAGKSSEYDFVLDPQGETATSNRRTVDATGFGALWSIPAGGVAETLARRAEALVGLPQRTVPDFCEMAIVCNATGLAPDDPGFHAPVMRAVEVADVFCPRAHGGLLERDNAIDVFNCLRRHDEASFTGGVFVVVRCGHRPTWEMLRAKGHVVSSDGAHAMLYHPAHLLGVEAPRSIIAAVRAGHSSAGEAVRPVCDLVARATRAFAAGAVLAISDRHSHSVDGLEPLLVDAAPIGEGRPLPYYMAVGRTLVRDVAAGAVITPSMVEPPGTSALWRLRAEQDRAFFDAA